MVCLSGTPAPFGDTLTVSFRCVCVEAAAGPPRCVAAAGSPVSFSFAGLCAVRPALPQPSPLRTALPFSSLDPVPRGGVMRLAEGGACHSEHGAGTHSRHAGSPRLSNSFGGRAGHSVHRRGNRGLARRPPRSLVGRVGPRSGRKKTVLLLLPSHSSRGEPGRSS